MGKALKQKQAKSGVIRNESQRQSKAKVAAKSNSKQRRSKENKKAVVKVEDSSPSDEILSSQDSIEESSASSQDSVQSTRFVNFMLLLRILEILEPFKVWPPSIKLTFKQDFNNYTEVCVTVMIKFHIHLHT